VSNLFFFRFFVVSSCNVVTVYVMFITQDVVMTSGMVQVDDCLLEGHLGITKELVSMQSAQKKFFIGAENGGCSMIKVSVFLFSYNCIAISPRGLRAWFSTSLTVSS
jgi:hypothetical protein